MSKMSSNELLESNILKLILKYSASTLTALILSNLYTLIDALFVSWAVGADAMGGISVAFPFVVVQSAISMALGTGAASIVSRKIGEGKKDEAGNVVFNTMITFWITALIITVLGLVFLNPMLSMLGVSQGLYEYARQYLIIILIGNVFSTGFSSIIRAEGSMKYGLLIWVIPISINIILDAIFIIGLGFGVKGSAVSTVISQFISFSMSIFYFTRLSALSFKGSRLNFKVISEVFSIGLPALIQQAGLAISLVVVNNALKYNGGDLAIKTYAYINKLIVIAFIPFTAIVQAISPIVGYNFGIGNNHRVKKTVRYSLLLSLGYSVFALIILEAIPAQLIGLFTAEEDVLMLGKTALRLTALSLVLTPASLILGASYQASGKKLSALFMYASNCVFLIPSIIVMSTLFGLNGVWLSLFVSGLFSTIFALLYQRKQSKKV